VRATSGPIARVAQKVSHYQLLTRIKNRQ